MNNIERKDIIATIIIVFIALVAAFVAELKNILTLNEIIIILLFVISILFLSFLFTYYLNINRINKYNDDLNNSSKKFEELLNRLTSHIYLNEKIISFEEVSKLINESQDIWVFNPLKKIDYFDESIKNSIKEGCIRRFIVNEADKAYFENYMNHLEEELNLDCKDYFKIAPWKVFGRPFVPISVVISRKDKISRVWLHLSQVQDIDSNYKYAFFFDEPSITFFFESWFIELWKKLTDEEIKLIQ